MSSTTTTTATETITTTNTFESEKAKGISSDMYEKGMSTTTSTMTTTLLTKVNEIDELISSPVFRLGLPKWLELLYSFPACIFGTSFSIMTMPLWIAVLALIEKQTTEQQHGYNFENNNDYSKLLLLKLITIGVTAVYVIGWGLFQQYGYNDLLIKLFYRLSLYQGGTPWCVAILAYTIPATNNNYNSNSDNDVFSMAIYPLFLWQFVMVIVSYLKKKTKRHRPAYKDLLSKNQKDDDKMKKWIENKKYPAMTEMLANHNHDASFPSGDAALACLFAIPIFCIGSTSSSDDDDYDSNYYYYKVIASVIVFLSASGRMYVLAHHFFDVTVGIAIPYMIHVIATFVGFGMYNMKWWYPLVTTASFMCYENLKEKRRIGE